MAIFGGTLQIGACKIQEVSLLMGDFLVDTFIEHNWHDLYKKTLSP